MNKPIRITEDEQKRHRETLALVADRFEDVEEFVRS
jgi:hypothetical protein